MFNSFLRTIGLKKGTKKDPVEAVSGRAGESPKKKTKRELSKGTQDGKECDTSCSSDSYCNMLQCDGSKRADNEGISKNSIPGDRAGTPQELKKSKSVRETHVQFEGSCRRSTSCRGEDNRVYRKDQEDSEQHGHDRHNCVGPTGSTNDPSHALRSLLISDMLQVADNSLRIIRTSVYELIRDEPILNPSVCVDIIVPEDVDEIPDNIVSQFEDIHLIHYIRFSGIEVSQHEGTSSKVITVKHTTKSILDSDMCDRLKLTDILQGVPILDVENWSKYQHDRSIDQTRQAIITATMRNIKRKIEPRIERDILRLIDDTIVRLSIYMSKCHLKPKRVNITVEIYKETFNLHGLIKSLLRTLRESLTKNEEIGVKSRYDPQKIFKICSDLKVYAQII
ncbi:TPA_asm: protein 5 [Asclepias syriaca virus 3]|uniref:Protein 5 n=1 Tax=Asclepias syriaca virus 3 TaxID=2977955 RepID=A0A9N6YIV8_9RHAB|nr:TPA_asm: protein 5 [Asclepias syriaca virus 3]